MGFYGAAMGLGLSALTTAGVARVGPRDAGIAGGLVNVFQHLGGALGLGILTTIFASANAADTGPEELLAHRIGAALTGASVLAAIALAVTVVVAPAGHDDSRFKAPVRVPAADPSGNPLSDTVAH